MKRTFEIAHKQHKSTNKAVTAIKKPKKILQGFFFSVVMVGRVVVVLVIVIAAVEMNKCTSRPLHERAKGATVTALYKMVTRIDFLDRVCMQRLHGDADQR